MAYTEVKIRNNRKYYYRVISIRDKEKVKKKRIYLGSGLSEKDLSQKECIADKELISYKIDPVLKPIIKKIISILKKYDVKKAGVFGSFARGEQKKKSDIDILIEPPARMGLKFVGLALDLEKKLGRKVDLVSYNGISPYLKKSILEDEKRIL